MKTEDRESSPNTVKGLVNGVKGDHIELILPYIIDEEHIKFITEILSFSIHRVIDQELQ